MLCHKCHADIADNAILCDVCGAVVTTAPIIDPVAVAKECRRAQRRRVMAFCLAAILLIVGVVGVLVDNSAEAVAKRYLKAYVDGDMKKTLSLYAGDMRRLLEDQTSETREGLFQMVEIYAKEVGVNASVKNYGQFYKVRHKAQKATNADLYGEDYTITTKVLGVENMSVQEFNIFLSVIDSENAHAYIDTDRLKIGKMVTVSVTIAGSKTSHTMEQRVPLVKYKGAWKVVVHPDSAMLL